MAFLFDHAAAAIAAGGVLLLVLAMLSSRTRADVDHTLGYADARRTEAMLQVMAADVASADSLTHLAPGDPRFAFVARPDVATGAPQVIEYRLTGPEGARVVERYVDGVRVGAGAPVRDWEIRALRADGAPAVRLDDARQVRVRLVTAAPDGAGRRWETTIAPPLLAPAGL